MTGIYVAQINYYPVKSCAGISVRSAELDARGIKHDRELMIVGKNKDDKYELVRQSRHPSMALILSNINNGFFSFVAPHMPSRSFPIVRHGDALDVIVHKNVCAAIDQGNEAAGWFSEALGGDYRVVRMADTFVRGVDPKYAPRGSDQVGFQDGYPLLLISEESLRDLNSHLKEKVLMNRFRPNLVIKGSRVPYIEDGMKRIKVGEMYFDVVKPCDRCPIPNINQERGTLDPNKEVTKALNKYRRAEFNSEGKVLFGQNIVHEAPGRINLGDKVEVMEYKKNEEKLQWTTK